jgi:hypothetical protein
MFLLQPHRFFERRKKDKNNLRNLNVTYIFV